MKQRQRRNPVQTVIQSHGKELWRKARIFVLTAARDGQNANDTGISKSGASVSYRFLMCDT